MNNKERAEAFTLYVGLELKGRIVSQGFTAATIADEMGRSRAAFSRWLNGKQAIPLSVVCEASELIGVDPGDVVSKAYDRLSVAHGEADGFQYPQDVVDEELASIKRETQAEESGKRVGASVHAFPSRRASGTTVSESTFIAAMEDYEGEDLAAEMEGHEEQP